MNQQINQLWTIWTGSRGQAAPEGSKLKPKPILNGSQGEPGPERPPARPAGTEVTDPPL